MDRLSSRRPQREGSWRGGICPASGRVSGPRGQGWAVASTPGGSPPCACGWGIVHDLIQLGREPPARHVADPASVVREVVADLEP